MKKKENNSWLDMLEIGLDAAKILAGSNPIGAVISIADAIVETTNVKVGISDTDVMETLSTMMKSKWNSLTPEKIEKIREILEEE